MITEKMKPKVLWLRERFKWMGNHSGYDQLYKAIAQSQAVDSLDIWRNPDIRLPKGSNRILSYLLSYLVKGAKVSPFYNHYSTLAELEVLWKATIQKPDLLHIAYVENDLGILLNWKQRLSLKIVGTAHQPEGWWRLMHQYEDSIAALDALIVPASREVLYFQKYLPGRVFFVPHGVDTVFFQPEAKSKDSSKIQAFPRCVFSGTWLRDINVLGDVIDRVVSLNPNIKFDMIVPANNRDNLAFYRIARHEQVTWHSGISDEQLRKIYQQASLLLLPLIDSTANNAILEAMSCGLPIVSNDVGGVRDYTKDTFADLLPVGDANGMTDAVLRLLNAPEELQNRGDAARLFAEDNFSWDKVAAQTLDIYHKLLYHTMDN